MQTTPILQERFARRRSPAVAWISSGRRTTRRVIRKLRCETRPIARYGFNLLPVVRYRLGVSPLNVAAYQVAQELRAEGVSMTHLDELIDDPDMLNRLQTYAELLRSELPSAARTANGSTPASKRFLVELLGERPALVPESPLVGLALHPQIRGVAEAYSGMKLRVHDVNVWLNLPSPAEAEQSQLWHRDLPEDHDIVKCFVYIRRVSEGNGPMRYVRRSNTEQGRRVRFPAEWDGVGYRVPDSVVRSVVPDGYIFEAVGGAGTVLFADTRGLHRGGHAIDEERLVIQITYASNACCRPRNLTALDEAAASQLADFRLAR